MAISVGIEVGTEDEVLGVYCQQYIFYFQEMQSLAVVDKDVANPCLPNVINFTNQKSVMEGAQVSWEELKGHHIQKDRNAVEHKLHSVAVEEKKEVLHSYFQNNLYNHVQEMANMLADLSDVPETGDGNTGMEGIDMVRD